MLKVSAIISLSVINAGAAHTASNVVDIPLTSDKVCVTL